MSLTKKHKIILGFLGIFLLITAVVGIAVGLSVGRKQSNQQSAHDILAQNPLIDG